MTGPSRSSRPRSPGRRRGPAGPRRPDRPVGRDIRRRDLRSDAGVERERGRRVGRPGRLAGEPGDRPGRPAVVGRVAHVRGRSAGRRDHDRRRPTPAAACRTGMLYLAIVVGDGSAGRRGRPGRRPGRDRRRGRCPSGGSAPPRRPVAPEAASARADAIALASPRPIHWSGSPAGSPAASPSPRRRLASPSSPAADLGTTLLAAAAAPADADADGPARDRSRATLAQADLGVPFTLLVGTALTYRLSQPIRKWWRRHHTAIRLPHLGWPAAHRPPGLTRAEELEPRLAPAIEASPPGAPPARWLARTVRQHHGAVQPEAMHAATARSLSSRSRAYGDQASGTRLGPGLGPLDAEPAPPLRFPVRRGEVSITRYADRRRNDSEDAMQPPRVDSAPATPSIAGSRSPSGSA